MLNDELARRHRPDEFPSPPARFPLGSRFTICGGSVAAACFGFLLIGAVIGAPFATVDGPLRMLLVVAMAGGVALNIGFVAVNLLARYRPDSSMIARFWPLFWPKGLPERGTWESVSRS